MVSRGVTPAGNNSVLRTGLGGTQSATLRINRRPAYRNLSPSILHSKRIIFHSSPPRSPCLRESQSAQTLATDGRRFQKMVSRGVTPAGNNSVLRTGLPRALGLTPVRALPLGRKPRQSAARLPLCTLRFSFIASLLLPPPLAEHCKLNTANCGPSRPHPRQSVAPFPSH